MSSAPKRLVLGRVLPLPAQAARRRRSPSSTSRWGFSIAAACRAMPSRPAYPFLALALLAASARFRGGARRRRARARTRAWGRRPAHDRRRVLPGFAHRRPRGPLGACSQLRRARARGLRAPGRPGSRQPAHEQPWRSQLPARQDRPGGGAAQGVEVHDSQTRGARRRRPARGLFLRAGSSPHRRASNRPRRRRARRSTFCARGRLRRRGRKRAARARPVPARAGTARRGRDSLPPPPNPPTASWDRAAIALPPWLRAATSKLAGGITNGRPSSIARLRKRSRTFASKSVEER